MLGIFCSTHASSNEDYKKYIIRRMYMLFGFLMLGFITIGTLVFIEFAKIDIEDYALGFYYGVGTALILASVILLIKNRFLLKDQNKLKKARIISSDERNIQINTLSIKVAVFILLIGIYFVMLIGGLWYPILTKTLSVLIFLFIFAYAIAYKIISKRI